MTARLSHQLGILAIAVVASSVTVFDYDIGRVDRGMQMARQHDHRAILDGVSKAPYRYRVLVPAITAVGIAAVTPLMPPDVAFRRISTLIDLLALTLMLLTLYWYVCHWFTSDQALVGVLLIACTVPIALRNHVYAPYSLVEPSLLTAGLICILRNRLQWLPLLSIAASLNRETGMLVPVACLLIAGQEPTNRSPRIRAGLVALALSLATLAIVRWWQGPAEPDVTTSAIWRMNLAPDGLRSAAVHLLLFAGGAGWILIGQGLQRVPRFVRQTYWLAALYLPLYLVWGVWYEVRLLMTLYPILLPVMLSGLYEPRDEAVITETPTPARVSQGARSR